MCKKCITAAPIALAPEPVNMPALRDSMTFRPLSRADRVPVRPSTVVESTLALCAAAIRHAEKPAVGTTLFSDMSNFEFVKMLRESPDLKGDAIAEAADRIEHLIAMNRNLGP